MSISNPALFDIVIRRLRRVVLSNSAAAILPVELDNIGRVWRAFEPICRTQTHASSMTQEVEAVFEDTLAKFPPFSLPRLKTFLSRTNHLHDVPDHEICAAMNQDVATATFASEKREIADHLADAARLAGRWTRRDSRILGRFMYDLRGGYVHAGGSTRDVMTGLILPTYATAMYEITAHALAVACDLQPAVVMKGLQRSDAT